MEPAIPYSSVRCVIQTSDDGYAVVGEQIIVADNDLSDIDAWFIKTDPEGVIPEFPSWIILPLFVTVTLVVTLFRKRLHLSKV